MLTWWKSKTDGYSPDGRNADQTRVLSTRGAVFCYQHLKFRCFLFEVNMDNRTKIKRITTIGMLSAIAYIFTLIGHLVPIYFNDFLKYDPKDAIIVIAGFSLGPLAALIISVIVALLELVTISTTGIIGCLMNIIASAAFACIAALVYKRARNIKGAVCGLILSSAVTVVLMLLWNYLITPLYMGIPREVVAGMLLPVFLPFNVIKCGLNSALTILIYKPCVQAMRRVGLLERRVIVEGENRPKASPALIISSLVVIAIMVALFIILR